MHQNPLPSALEPLAQALYAMELAGLDADGASPEAIEAAEQGEAFALTCDFEGQTRLELRFDPASAHYELAVHLMGGYARQEVVLAALQLNHTLASRSRRFSLEPYSGDVVLSEVLPWAEAQAQELAQCACDLIVLMAELEDLQPLDDSPEPVLAPSDALLSTALRG